MNICWVDLLSNNDSGQAVDICFCYQVVSETLSGTLVSGTLSGTLLSGTLSGTLVSGTLSRTLMFFIALTFGTPTCTYDFLAVVFFSVNLCHFLR